MMIWQVSRHGLEIAEISCDRKGRVLAAQRPLKSLPTLRIWDYNDLCALARPVVAKTEGRRDGPPPIDVFMDEQMAIMG
jgi:hypothetical protein